MVSTKVAHRKCTKICEDNEHDNAGDNDWYADKKYALLIKNLISISL